MNREEALILLEKYKRNACTKEEIELLEYWVHHLNEHEDHGLSAEKLDTISASMWSVIDGATKVRSIKTRWMAVAAAMLLFAVAGLLYKASHNHLTSVKQTDRLANKIHAGGNKATLTLDNGKVITIDNSFRSELVETNGVKVSKNSDGELVYEMPKTTIGKKGLLSFNTLTTPKGGQYQIKLPDGSKVWLNAQSSLRFPLQFDAKMRVVELTGEAYFEVKHLNPADGKKVRFIVQTAGKIPQTVEVLGTHFNINAYNDESVVKTTLLKGSVRVTPSSSTNKHLPDILLKPGEQSVLNAGKLSVSKVDVEEAIAWKNGYFRFNDESLESIMRKVGRWYDVNVEYDDPALKSIHFGGVTSRFTNVAELLKMLELTGEVQFKIQGSNIVVLKKK